jgi:hypothetical protein
MPRLPRAPTLGPEPLYAAWKADAVKELQKRQWSAAAATRDSVWTNLYVRGFSPEEAAKVAEREYHSAHPFAQEEQMIGTERTHKVNVWSLEVEITVYHQYETVWIAYGDYMGERIQCKGLTRGAAISSWIEAARRKATCEL